MDELVSRIRESVLSRMDLSRDLTDEEIGNLIGEETARLASDISLSLHGRIQLERRVFNSLRRLDALQELVGGYIETVNLPGGIVMIVNEEGRILRLPINFHLNCDLIRGTAVFVSVNGEDFCSLNQAQENAVWRAMSYVI